ncbi:hypothetical protein [Salinicola aestuarinus]|uniref:hypothetical protein n=1 Tax=Salinicola aestuarinus TaxID=1949082 RepID=UPI000DA1E8A6|nr:hypothetical protein [Salinicola aestuarinus]
MSQINLALEGLSTPEDLNRVTTALMMVDGVETVDIGRDWAEVDGNASRAALIEAVAALNGGYAAR